MMVFLAILKLFGFMRFCLSIADINVWDKHVCSVFSSEFKATSKFAFYQVKCTWFSVDDFNPFFSWVLFRVMSIICLYSFECNCTVWLALLVEDVFFPVCVSRFLNKKSCASKCVDICPVIQFNSTYQYVTFYPYIHVFIIIVCITIWNWLYLQKFFNYSELF